MNLTSRKYFYKLDKDKNELFVQILQSAKKIKKLHYLKVR